jgi:hypothetical protein
VPAVPAEEGEHVVTGVAQVGLVRHLAGPDVERGEQIDGAAALVVSGRHVGLGFLQRERRLGTVLGPALCLLAEAEHHGTFRGIEVEPDHVNRVWPEPRIVRQKVSTRHGRRFLARQMPATVSFETPWRSPNVRVDQHDDPSSGIVCSVSSTIGSMTDWSISGLRPRPGAIDPTALMPPPANLARQRRKASGVVAHARAIASLSFPSAASSRAQACTMTRGGSDGERARRSNPEHCLRVALSGAAVMSSMQPL